MKKKIVLGIPCLLRGGTEVQTLQLVKALLGGETIRTETGPMFEQVPIPELVVVCYFESEQGVVEEFYAAGAKVNRLNLDRTIRPLAFIKTLTKVFRKARADILHIQYMAPGFLAVVAARLSSAGSVIATVHQPWTRKHHGYNAKILLRTAALLCKRFTCVSEAAERSWFGTSQLYRGEDESGAVKRSPRWRHATIYNAIDIVRIDEILGQTQQHPLRKALGLEGCVVVGAVARLSHIKGVDLLLEAFARVKNQFRGGGLKRAGKVSQTRQGLCDGRMMLVVVGDGEENDCLRRQAANLELSSQDLGGAALDLQSDQQAGENDVLWLGRLSWEESIKVMSTFDICVVPSRFEGFGLSAAEAMACGKPVVAADVGGLPEVVGRDGLAGKLYASECIHEMALHLLALIQSKKERETLGNCGRRRVTEFFGFERFRASITSLYGSQCRRPSRWF